MKNKFATIAILIFAIVGTVMPFSFQTVSAAQSRTILFPVMGKWYICQGYNTPEISHTGRDVYGFDLSPDKNSFSGLKGCNPTTNKAASGAKVYAPANGTVTYLNSNPDIMQLKLNNGGGCIRIAHFTKQYIGAGKSVKQGDLIGTLSAPNAANGNYSHLHISVYSDTACTIPVGFEEKSNFRIYGATNFPATITKYAYRGKSISYTAPSINFDGYCKATGYDGVVLYGNTVYDWKCKSVSRSTINDIDPNNACIWQYMGLFNVAKFTNKNDPYSWGCYKS